jgi:hypothetical protein
MSPISAYTPCSRASLMTALASLAATVAISILRSMFFA